MKKIHILLLAVSVSVMITACHRGKRTTINNSDGVNNIHLQYSGRIVFADDNKSISSMSPDSYFEFKRNDEELSAKSDNKGHIIYELSNGAKSTTLDEKGKQLMLEAAKEIAKAQGKKI
ncbi:hypothetical protein HQ865_20790 [Mucilaginibacter mali]|uniref:Lipoprotein n=1 Tax=Mucilaginibacter mali TaxID=2740462 RepID=A0A7D4TZC7_9SPHI|nr:hypothetical protein [Mucilaginibacter mali]QKJ32097.1 hypothetical protein HQ865_20790 [Mucilaginibacter mali]